ncbi:hypothetical protein [Nocardia sp. NPDC051832]|uniref:hypothetical protein n=1 Tax=Nocardia sp. NPDC051832 TaxID=3155673 RepID=UPI00342465CF
MQKLFFVTAVTAAALSLAACGGDIATAAPAASEVPTPAPTTAVPVGTVEPTALIMIDPDGDKWNRARTVREARRLVESVREAGAQLPANFCEQGYIEGLEGGGQFPSGKQAWLDACEEGVRQAG